MLERPKDGDAICGCLFEIILRETVAPESYTKPWTSLTSPSSTSFPTLPHTTLTAGVQMGYSSRTTLLSWFFTTLETLERMRWLTYLCLMHTRRSEQNTMVLLFNKQMCSAWRSAKDWHPGWWFRLNNWTLPFSLLWKLSLQYYFPRSVNSHQTRIEDNQVITQYRTFLQVLKQKTHTMTPFPRCIIPDGFHPVGINGNSDGSVHLSIHVFYIFSSADHQTIVSSCYFGQYVRWNTIQLQEIRPQEQWC